MIDFLKVAVLWVAAIGLLLLPLGLGVIIERLLHRLFAWNAGTRAFWSAFATAVIIVVLAIAIDAAADAVDWSRYQLVVAGLLAVLAFMRLAWQTDAVSAPEAFAHMSGAAKWAIAVEILGRVGGVAFAIVAVESYPDHELRLFWLALAAFASLEGSDFIGASLRAKAEPLTRELLLALADRAQTSTQLTYAVRGEEPVIFTFPANGGTKDCSEMRLRTHVAEKRIRRTKLRNLTGADFMALVVEAA